MNENEKDNLFQIAHLEFELYFGNIVRLLDYTVDDHVVYDYFNSVFMHGVNFALLHPKFSLAQVKQEAESRYNDIELKIPAEIPKDIKSGISSGSQNVFMYAVLWAQSNLKNYDELFHQS